MRQLCELLHLHHDVDDDSLVVATWIRLGSKISTTTNTAATKLLSSAANRPQLSVRRFVDKN